jgi:uncharacterized protein YndB with AHSA1/START domain
MSAPPTTELEYTFFIRATPAQVWAAITDPDMTSRYFYGSRIESTYEPGSPIRGIAGDGATVMSDGEILAADAPRFLQYSWRALFDPACADESASRVTCSLEPQEDGTVCLTLRHDRLDDAPVTAANVAVGWSYILSGLKTLVETGEPMAA